MGSQKIIIAQPTKIISEKIIDFLIDQNLDPIYTTGLGDALRSMQIEDIKFIMIDVDFFVNCGNFCKAVKAIQPGIVVSCIGEEDAINSGNVAQSNFDFRFTKPLNNGQFIELATKATKEAKINN